MFIAKTPEDLYAHVVNCISSMNLLRHGNMHVELPEPAAKIEEEFPAGWAPEAPVTAVKKIPKYSPPAPAKTRIGKIPFSTEPDTIAFVSDNSGDNSADNSGDNSGDNSDDNSGDNSGDNSVHESIQSIQYIQSIQSISISTTVPDPLICNPITDDNPNRTDDSDAIWLNLLPLPAGLAATRDPEHYPKLRINNTTIDLHMPNITVYNAQNLPRYIKDRLLALQALNMKCGITVVYNVHQATIEQTSVEIDLREYWPIGNRYASLYNAIYDKFDVYVASGFIPHDQIMNPETQYKLTAKFLDIGATYCLVRGFGPTICKKYGVGAWQDRIYICNKIREIRPLPTTVQSVNCASCNILCYGRAYTPDNSSYYCRCCAMSDVHVSSNILFVVKCANKLKESINIRLGTDASRTDKLIAKHIRMLYKYESRTRDIRSYFPSKWSPGVDGTGAKIEMGVIETIAKGITYIGIAESWMDFMLCTRGRGANMRENVVYYSVQM